MNEQLLRAYVWFRARTTGLIKDESGEGVISAAIAVLIVAFLGALMWVAFNQLWKDTSAKTTEQVNKIGQ
jgi:hypothetical protein